MFLTKIHLLFFRIGLCGFDNPHRDQKTEEVRRHIGQVRYFHYKLQKHLTTHLRH